MAFEWSGKLDMTHFFSYTDENKSLDMANGCV